MALKLGTSDASLRIGGATPLAAYLGAVQVWSAATVPGAPTITSAFYNSPNNLSAVVYAPPADDGGSPVTAYRFYIGGVLTEPSSNNDGTAVFDGEDFSGQQARVSAVNAVGEGPQSDPATF